MPTLFDQIFDSFGTSRFGQIMAAVAVMAAFVLLIWLRARNPTVHLWSFLMYGGAMGLVAGLVLTVLKRGMRARGGKT